MERNNKTWRLPLYPGTKEKIQSPRTLKAEQKKIEIELWQKKNKLLWRRREGMSQETQEEIERKREFHRVIVKIRNLQKPNETGQGTSRQQTGEIQHNSEIPELEDVETMSPVQKIQSQYLQ